MYSTYLSSPMTATVEPAAVEPLPAAPPVTLTALDGGLIEIILSYLPAACLARAGRVDQACQSAQAMAAVGAANRLQWPLCRRDGESAAHALRGVELLAAHACSLAAGASHTLCICRGTLYSCGGHPHLEGAIAHLGLGHESGDYVQRPAVVAMPEGTTSLDVRCVSAGGAHSALLTAAGELYTWGAKGGGRLGLGPLPTNQPLPRLVRLPGGVGLRIVQVACGSRHTLMLTEVGSAFSCGANDYGQLGTGVARGRAANARVPVPVLSPIHAAAAAASDSDDAYEADAGGEAEMVGEADGADGADEADEVGGGSRRPVGALARWAAVCACEDHSAALTTAAEMYAWGSNHDGQLGIESARPPALHAAAVRSPTRIGPHGVCWAKVSAGPSTVTAVSTAGAVFTAFMADGFRCVPLPPGAVVRQAVAGGGYMALLGRLSGREGEVWLMSLGRFCAVPQMLQMELGADGEAPERALEIAMGHGHLLARTASGAIWAHGQDSPQGQLGLGGQSDTTLSAEGEDVDFARSMVRWADDVTGEDRT